MKDKLKIFLSVFISGIVCSLVFIGTGYFYLDNKLRAAEEKTESVPYYTALPQNAGILFNICEELTLCYLDFEEKTVSVVSAQNYTLSEGKIAGYTVDYTVEGDFTLVAGIIDTVGGIDLETEEGILSFTGVQIEEILTESIAEEEIKNKITEEIFSKISKNGFRKEDFLYIIENSKTNLSVPDCYYWEEYMKDMCYNVRYIR